MKTLLKSGNPPSEKSIASFLKTIVAAINKIINHNLQLKKKAKKHDVHQFLPRHAGQCRIFCRTRHENYLTEDKWKYMKTLVEAWIYLKDCINNKEKVI